MARRKRKTNPTGALLVNPRRPNKRRTNRKGKASKAVSLKHLFSAVGGLKRRTNRRKRNPLVSNRRRRTNASYRVMNPLINPLVSNRRRKHNRRRKNPGYFGAIAKIPVIGPLLGSTLMGLGGALAGGIASFPLYYGVKPVYARLPAMLKPVAFSIAGSLFAAVLGAFVPTFKFKDKLVLALAVGGGAIDGYRAISSKMGAFAGDDYGDIGEIDGDDVGEIDGDDMGDDGYGDAGDVRPAEWADADLQDATYSGEDLSADEITWSGYGRSAYRKRFKGKKGGAQHAGASDHAGKPGARWAWLIYWVGFDNFKAVAAMPENKRRDVIHKARHAALQAARQAISVAPDTRVESAEKAGLLAIH